MIMDMARMYWHLMSKTEKTIVFAVLFLFIIELIF
jgi:hypothetical protein